MWAAISSVVSGLVSPVATYLTQRAQINAAQHAADLAAVQAQGQRQADLIKQGMADDAAWEMASLEAGKGWARNFELVVLTIPVIMCFVGDKYAAIVKAGFAALATTPVWFQTAFLTVFMANYGIRMWRRQQTDT